MRINSIVQTIWEKVHDKSRRIPESPRNWHDKYIEDIMEKEEGRGQAST